MFNQIRDRIAVHSLDETNLGRSLSNLISRINPQTVVFGEAPLRGNMWITHRVVTNMSLPQVCIENFYGQFCPEYFTLEWPAIDRWLLIGILPEGDANLRNDRIVVVRPLIGIDSMPDARDRVCVFGYDDATLDRANRILSGLEPQSVDYFVTPEMKDRVSAQSHTRVFVLPSDVTIAQSLARASLVIGKAGFQQIAEALSMGAPIVCIACGGGVTPESIPDYMQPFVRFVRDEGEITDLTRSMSAWLAALPSLPWSSAHSGAPHPAAVAASELKWMLQEPRSAPDESGMSISDATAWPRLGRLAYLVEQKRWNDLEHECAHLRLSVDGGIISVARLAQDLARRTTPNTSAKVVPMARLASGEYRWCLMTLDPGSWTYAELEFEALPDSRT